MLLVTMADTSGGATAGLMSTLRPLASVSQRLPQQALQAKETRGKAAKPRFDRLHRECMAGRRVQIQKKIAGSWSYLRNAS